MTVKKRIISICLLCLLVISSFVVTVCALSNEQKGENYDSSHNDNQCCASTDGLHYDQGYEDGLTDGIADGFNGGYSAGQSNPSQEALNEAINDYLNNNQEYLDYLNEQLAQAEQNGYLNAMGELDNKAEAMYKLGLIDGELKYMESEEYLKTLGEFKQSGYDKGYIDGHTDGAENSVKPGTLISLFATLIALIIATLAITYFAKKKGKKKK